MLKCFVKYDDDSCMYVLVYMSLAAVQVAKWSKEEMLEKKNLFEYFIFVSIFSEFFRLI